MSVIELCVAMKVSNN